MRHHSPVVEVVRPTDRVVPARGQHKLVIITIFKPLESPLEGHHDSQANGEVEDDVVDGIEKLREDIGVDFRMNIVWPLEDPQ